MQGEVAVRKLRQWASDPLRRVEAVATIEVTNRGRPVGLLTPVPEADLWRVSVPPGGDEHACG